MNMTTLWCMTLALHLVNVSLSVQYFVCDWLNMAEMRQPQAYFQWIQIFGRLYCVNGDTATALCPHTPCGGHTSRVSAVLSWTVLQMYLTNTDLHRKYPRYVTKCLISDSTELQEGLCRATWACSSSDFVWAIFGRLPTAWRAEEVRDVTSACYPCRNAFESESSPSKPHILFFSPYTGNKLATGMLFFLTAHTVREERRPRARRDHLERSRPQATWAGSAKGKMLATWVTTTGKNVSLNQIWSHLKPSKQKVEVITLSFYISTSVCLVFLIK